MRSESFTVAPVATGQELEETSREALGRFLRARREAIAPEQVGISSRRGRRTPGLRREEVAFLADIGVKWYARLEAGDEIHPSEATLTGIAVALKLSNAEFEYMLDLAGLRPPRLPSEIDATIPQPIPALLQGLNGVAATACDRILTPLQWNGLADALYAHSRYETPVERNGLVRSLFDPYFIAFLGSEREALVYRAVGMLRLNLSAQTPSPYGAAVFERVKDDPFFRCAWSRRIVASELSNEEVMVRHHPTAGSLFVYAIDCNTTLRPELIVRVLAPANSETAEKFKRLEGAASPHRPVGKALQVVCN